MKLSLRRREAGFSLVEAAVSGFVVAVSVAGLVISVLYGRQLEKSTGDTWRATSAATAALESMRADSMQSWTGMKDDWQDQQCSESGFGDPIGDKLITEVSDESSGLDEADGMWNAGATRPNFYVVQISPGEGGDGLSRSLRFQTYVANRGGITADDGGGDEEDEEGGEGGPGDGTSASYVSGTASSVTFSSAGNKTVSFKLTNSGSLPLIVTQISAVQAGNKKLTKLVVNGTVLYNNTGGTTTITLPNVALTLAAGLAAGDIDFTVTSKAADLAQKNVTVTLTFLDGSVATTTVGAP